MRNAAFITAIVVFLGAGLAWIWWPDEPDEERPMGERIVKSDAEWRQVLTDKQFQVTRQAGTERAWTGEYAKCHQDGVYTCVCCGQPLFDSKTKFESGTGWPSFYEPAVDKNVVKKKEGILPWAPTEVLCSRCDAHLGHVFNDAPSQPTGLRYCINSAALKLVERGSETSEKE